jgi:ribonuclease BN (tRNA processing enzyme)
VKLTVVGSGDAFGSGGRANTCFLIEAKGRTVALDFGATSLVRLRADGLDPKRIDTVVLSHLHGDHFGGLPFLLLFRQFDCAQRRPLTVIGPPGTAERLRIASEAFFPGSSAIELKFPFRVVEVAPGEPHQAEGFDLLSHEVIHPSGAPSTGVRLRFGKKLLAYSGDSEWTDALFDVAKGADLFICECYKPTGAPTYHMSLELLRKHRDRLGAKRIMLTHMSDEMLANTEAARAEGYEIAHDGLVTTL